jgi:tryptophan synthase alpha chain
MRVLEMIARVRSLSDIPIVLFGYFNPVYVFGCEAFAQQARTAGVDAILVVDLPLEESAELRRYTDRAGIDFISLVAPTTSDERIRQITSSARGFVYYISVTGVTGTAKPQAEDIRHDVARIRRASDLPVVAGFGISTPDQAAQIARHADGVVIGSAVVKLIEQNAGREDLIPGICSFTAAVKEAMAGVVNL